MPILNLWPADLNLHHHKPSRGGPTLKAVRHPAAGAAYSFCFDSLLSPKKNRPSLFAGRSEEHTSELQSRGHLVCRLLLEKKKEKDDLVVLNLSAGDRFEEFAQVLLITGTVACQYMID